MSWILTVNGKTQTGKVSTMCPPVENRIWYRHLFAGREERQGAQKATGSAVGIVPPSPAATATGLCQPWRTQARTSYASTEGVN